MPVMSLKCHLAKHELTQVIDKQLSTERGRDLLKVTQLRSIGSSTGVQWPCCRALSHPRCLSLKQSRPKGRRPQDYLLWPRNGTVWVS